jgi:hypothetical protein
MAGTHGDAGTAGSDDLSRVSLEISGRLSGLGISLDGSESPEDLLQIVNAVERFERAVQASGGDLMVDEGPHGKTTQPDDPHSALPQRRADESVAGFVERLARATDDVQRHRKHD